MPHPRGAAHRAEVVARTAWEHGGMAAEEGPWEQLARGVELAFPAGLAIPRMFDVELSVPEPAPVADVEAAARAEVVGRLAG
ncbi:MAG: hypothetical protein WAS51_07335, partial [Ilumatobacteraceae bacterium]